VKNFDPRCSIQSSKSAGPTGWGVRAADDAARGSRQGDGREVLLVEAVVAPRQLELRGPNQAKAIEQLGAKRIVAGFAAVQRQQCGPGAIVPPDPRQHRALFVVRVRRRLEQTGGGAQLEQALPRAARGAIERIPSIRHCLAVHEQRQGESKSGTEDYMDAARGGWHGPDCTGLVDARCTTRGRCRQLCALGVLWHS
jgi:hypothetical protein